MYLAAVTESVGGRSVEDRCRCFVGVFQRSVGIARNDGVSSCAVRLNDSAALRMVEERGAEGESVQALNA